MEAPSQHQLQFGAIGPMAEPPQCEVAIEGKIYNERNADISFAEKE